MDARTMVVKRDGQVLLKMGELPAEVGSFYQDVLWCDVVD
jgi:hypothetical protein